MTGSINPRSFESVVVQTDGAGNIAVQRKTGGVRDVTFSTDGSNGIIVVDIDDQPDDNYAAWGSISVGSVGAGVQPTTAAGVCLFTAHTAAGAAINLATTATQMSLCFVFAANMPSA